MNSCLSERSSSVANADKISVSIGIYCSQFRQKQDAYGNMKWVWHFDFAYILKIWSFVMERSQMNSLLSLLIWKSAIFFFFKCTTYCHDNRRKKNYIKKFLDMSFVLIENHSNKALKYHFSSIINMYQLFMSDNTDFGLHNIYIGKKTIHSRFIISQILK